MKTLLPIIVSLPLLGACASTSEIRAIADEVAAITEGTDDWTDSIAGKIGDIADKQEELVGKVSDGAEKAAGILGYGPAADVLSGLLALLGIKVGTKKAAVAVVKSGSDTPA